MYNRFMGAIKRSDFSQKGKVRRGTGKRRELGMMNWQAGPMFSDVCTITLPWPIPQRLVSPFSVFSYTVMPVCTNIKGVFFTHT